MASLRSDGCYVSLALDLHLLCDLVGKVLAREALAQDCIGRFFRGLFPCVSHRSRASHRAVVLECSLADSRLATTMDETERLS